MNQDYSNWVWLNEPKHHWENGNLLITTNSETGFWQGTHTGFRRDNGHCLLTEIDKDFSLKTKCKIDKLENYNQAGLIIRINNENWITTALVGVDKNESEIWSVVTNYGYSDLSKTAVEFNECHFRVQGKGLDFICEYSKDGKNWSNARIAHLHYYPGRLMVGLYASSPTQGAETDIIYEGLVLEQRKWDD